MHGTNVKINVFLFVLLH